MRDKREKDWFWLDNALVDREDIGAMEKLVYMLLARFSDGYGKSFPSLEKLSSITGIKDYRTLVKYIKNLEEKGFLEIIKRKGKSNIYYLKNVKAIEDEEVPTKFVDTPPAKNVGTKNDTTYKICKKVPTKNVGLTRLNNKTQQQGENLDNFSEKENSVAVVAGENSEEEIYKPITETGEEKINSALKNEVRLLLGTRKIDPQKIINLGKPITRIKQVIDYCNAHNKNNGYLLCALRDDYELYKPTPKTREEPYYPKKTRQEEEFLF